MGSPADDARAGALLFRQGVTHRGPNAEHLEKPAVAHCALKRTGCSMPVSSLTS
jgi:hypothetical protein